MDMFEGDLLAVLAKLSVGFQQIHLPALKECRVLYDNILK